MAFNRSAGPPASRRQLETLQALLRDAGHEDFRDARGPMGFTQRQANGKFTRDEAELLIAQLENAGYDCEGSGGEGPPAGGEAAPESAGARDTSSTASLTPAERDARRLATGVLAAELQRSGWVVMEP
jgi:hypothetical protein